MVVGVENIRGQMSVVAYNTVPLVPRHDKDIGLTNRMFCSRVPILQLINGHPNMVNLHETTKLTRVWSHLTKITGKGL